MFHVYQKNQQEIKWKQIPKPTPRKLKPFKIFVLATLYNKIDKIKVYFLNQGRLISESQDGMVFKQ